MLQDPTAPKLKGDIVCVCPMASGCGLPPHIYIYICVCVCVCSIRAAVVWPMQLRADAYLKGASASMVTTHGEMLDACSTHILVWGDTSREQLPCQNTHIAARK